MTEQPRDPETGQFVSHEIIASTISSDGGGSSETQSQTHEITAAEQNQRANMQMRHALVAAIDSQLGGGQSKYDVFNWDESPTVEQFYGAYLRNAYARAVCDMPVQATWRDPPKIVDKGEESEGTDTEFEQAVQEQADELRVFHYMKRADVLSGIGEYGLLVLEFDDISSHTDFEQEVDDPDELTGVKVYSQASVEEIVVGGPGSGRWGEPMTYTLDLSDENDEVTHNGPDELDVHHSRVIHIPSEGMLDDEIRGTPRLQPIWNNITDIEKALGSAGELAYRASAWGLNINIDSDYQLDDGGEAQDEHLQRWYYGLEPFLKTQGADEVQSLGGEEINPKLVIDPNIEAISAEKGIPQSVLKGNETGEMATEQDLKEWYGHVGSRRTEHVSPQIVQAFYDRQLRYGTLPAPAGQDPEKDVGGFESEWESLAEEDPKGIAEVKQIRAEVLETWPEIEMVLTMDQQREWIDEGTLPSEIDDLGIPESELDPPEMNLGNAGEGEDEGEGPAASEGGQQPPALADGGEESNGDDS